MVKKKKKKIKHRDSTSEYQVTELDKEKHEGGKLWKQAKENFPVMNDLILFVEWGLSYI